MSVDELYTDPCPNCGGQIPHGVDICPNCKWVRPAQQQAAPPLEPTCPNCGYAMPPTVSMCPHCGWTRTPPGTWPPVIPGRYQGPPQPPYSPAVKPRTSRIVQAFLYIAGTAAGFAAMLLGGYLGSLIGVLFWLGLGLPLGLFFATLKRLPFFAWGVLLSMPLLFLGAIVWCFSGMWHYNQ